MSEELVITSAANPRLKALTALRRRRTREEQGRTLVEGFEEVELALAAPLRAGDPPVVGRIADGRLLLDVRTLTDEEADRVAAAVRAARA